MQSANPRRTALDILLRVEKERSYADVLLDHALSRLDIHGPDRGLLTELVYGVLRRQATLDHIAGQFSSTKVAKLERAVLLLLRLGLYQVLFLDRIPVSAAVNETVKLAKALAPRATGFVNAVLRQADRQRNAIGYPDPQEDPAAYLAARFSHPRWLVQQWIRQLGREEAEQLAEAMSLPSPLTIRVNTLATSREALLSKLKSAGVDANPTSHAPHGIRLVSSAAPAELPGFREGEFVVQDESSQLAALLLDPQPGERILDLCAAPGGKASYIAQLMENRGHVLATDVAERKLRLIQETVNRLGITIIETRAADAISPSGIPEDFDRVLVDAPCSGLGVLRRHPEGKWWKRPEDVEALARTQSGILRAAATKVRPGGIIVYATCSTTEEENERVVDNFLSDRRDFVLEEVHGAGPLAGVLMNASACFRTWPHKGGMDGFFAARMKRQPISPA